eukprot:3359727-Pleurochrysis_carterae.AAC.5
MWRMVVPASEGLNGASAPYGLGIPTMSSGMYAFGRGSAVVWVSSAGAVSCSTLRESASCARRERSCSYRSHSRSISSEGGRPRCKFSDCWLTSASCCWFSCASFIDVACAKRDDLSSQESACWDRREKWRKNAK